MKLLIDTHTFLWWVQDDVSLSAKARAAIADPAHECLFSVASGWEMAIKISLGKLKIPSALDRFLPEQLAANHVDVLGIETRHLARVAALPFHHRDPFDRLLAAQALEDKLTIVSVDPIFKRYGVKEIW